MCRYFIRSDGGVTAINEKQNPSYLTEVVEHKCWTEITEAEYLARLPKEKPNPNLIRIAELKAKLSDSDYKLFKYLEGAMSKEEYIPIMRQRQAWRDEINKLENQEPQGLREQI